MINSQIQMRALFEDLGRLHSFKKDYIWHVIVVLDFVKYFIALNHDAAISTQNDKTAC
jgi:hypothetical protein